MFPSIVITGAHSTGKSTILKEIIPWLSTKVSPGIDIVYIAELARKLRKEKGYGLYREGMEKFQLAILSEYIRAWENNKSKLRVADRFFPDQYAYAAANGCWPELLEMIVRVYNKFKNEVTVMFYTPIEFPIVSDGLRDLDEGYRKKVDDQFLKFFELPENKDDIFYIVKGKIEERIDFVKDKIIYHFGQHIVKGGWV